MLWNGLAQGTRTVYTTAVKAYVLLCRLRLLDPWPATEESLIAYACTRAQGCSLLNLNSLAPKTISNHVSALRSYHVDHGLSCAVFESERLRRVLQGITACFNEPKARLRHPLTKDILRAMLRTRVAYPSGHAQIDDLNFRTALKVGYAGFLRLGKLRLTQQILQTRMCSNGTTSSAGTSGSIGTTPPSTFATVRRTGIKRVSTSA